MKLSIVDKGTSSKKKDNRGRPTKYQHIYDELKILPEDKEMPVKCDSEKEAKRLHAAVRHKQGFTTKKRGKTVIITHKENS